jgi:hypothetical protein
VKGIVQLHIQPTLLQTRLTMAAQRALAFALLHFIYGLYLGYSGDFDFAMRPSPGLGIPAALLPALFLMAAAFPLVFLIDLMGQASVIHRHAFWATLIGAGIAGGLLGALMLSAALEHNPQGAFSNENGIAYAALSVIFYGWFLALFLPITSALLTLLLIFGLQQRRREARQGRQARQGQQSRPPLAPQPQAQAGR